MHTGLLASITRGYRFLQGLRLVPLGALLVAWQLIEPSWPKSNIRDTVLAACIVLSLACAFLIGRYYENRFGRAQQSGNIFGVVIGLLAFFLTSWLDTQQDVLSVTSLYMACFFAAGAFILGAARWYALVPATVFLVLSLLPSATSLSVNEIDHRLFSVTLGLSLVMIGVLDHRLLVRHLGQTPAHA